MPELPNPATVPSDPNELMQAATCAQCIPKGMELPVIIWLVQQYVENTMTTDQLLQAASCYKCIPADMQLVVLIYLLDQFLQSQ